MPRDFQSDEPTSVGRRLPTGEWVPPPLVPASPTIDPRLGLRWYIEQGTSDSDEPGTNTRRGQ